MPLLYELLEFIACTKCLKVHNNVTMYALLLLRFVNYVFVTRVETHLNSNCHGPPFCNVCSLATFKTSSQGVVTVAWREAIYLRFSSFLKNRLLCIVSGLQNMRRHL